MRTTLALFAGFVGALALFLSMGAQFAASAKNWPPHPRDVWHVDGQDTGASSLPPGQEIVFYTVPAKKWLVITHFTGAYSGSGGAPGDVWAYVRGVAEAGGIERDRIPLYSDFSSGGELGFVFAPGTDLKFSNRQASISAVEVGDAVLHGYLLPNRPAFRFWSLSSADFPGPVPPASSVVIGTTPTDGWLFVSWVNRDDSANGTQHPQILAQQVCWRRGSTKQTIQHGITPHDWNTVGTPIPPGSDILLENASLDGAWTTPSLLVVGLVTEQ